MNQSQRILEAFSINVAKTPLAKARKWTEKEFAAEGEDLDETIPNFDTNYVLLSRAAKRTLGTVRKNMPVIRQKQIAAFQDDMKGQGTVVRNITTPASRLKPIQKEIWLENIIGPILQFGVANSQSLVVNTVTITSEDMFIIDGHHRWGQAMVSDPSLEMKTMVVSMPIKELLKVARQWGIAAGNRIREDQ